MDTVINFPTILSHILPPVEECWQHKLLYMNSHNPTEQHTTWVGPIVLPDIGEKKISPVTFKACLVFKIK